MSPMARYALFQLPGIAGAAILGWALWRWAGLPSWAAIAIVVAWIAKDVALYPFVRGAYEAAPEGAATLIGRRGVVRKRLAPRGTVAFGVELWRAETAPGATPIESGSAVRVVAVRGLVLLVAVDAVPVDRTGGAGYRAGVLSILLAVLLFAATAGAEATPMTVQVLESYPHDPRAFTQGLQLHDGVLYESTGLVGRSSLRQVDLASGHVLRQKDLPPPLFGEGLAWANGELVQLTWQNDRALRWDPATFDARGEWHFDGEGWGLCFDGKALVQSDGSHRLYFRDPATFAVLRTLAVTDNGQPVTRLNELECVGDTIYANVWMTDRIVAIAAMNGMVRATIDASGLLTAEERQHSGNEAILNGIAFDPASNTYLLTGKLWPRIFRVRFVPR